MFGIIIAIVILSFIVLIHEAGHLLVAKIFGVPVKEFSLGMGKRIFSTVKGNTRYSIKILPFGGSCSMVGEDIAGSGDFSYEGGEETVDGKIDFDGVIFTKEEIEKNNFSVISPLKRILICVAGPGANFILGMICAFILVMITGIDRPIVREVVPNSAVATASPYQVEANDEIIEIETYFSKEKIYNTKDLMMFLTLNSTDIIESKQPIMLTIKRDGSILKTMFMPQTENGIVKLGILLIGKQNIKNIFELINATFHEFTFYIKATVYSLRHLILGKVSVNEISGPVGTVAFMGSSITSVSDNIMAILVLVLSLTELITINLGVMNLIPIPALDGGRILEGLIEIIIRRPISKRALEIINGITMLLLLLFMLYIFGLDIYKIFTGRF